MTVQPTHQSADDRKFVKVGELIVPTNNYAPEIWQEVNTGEVVHRYPGGLVAERSLPFCPNPGDLTPIPQPEVRWIGVNTSSNMASNYMASKGAAISWFTRGGYDPANFFIRIETLNGVRTASVEEV